jgi:hypothetical protein
MVAKTTPPVVGASASLKPALGNPITRIPGNPLRIHSMRAAAILARLDGLRCANPL